METTRARLLRAAEDVIRRDGVRGMTLESVAWEAGVSKGGLLYHFHTKRDLVAGMTEARAEMATTAIDHHLDEHPEGGVTGAYVALAEPPHSHLDTALLAAAVEQPQLLTRHRQALMELHHRMRAGAADPVLATVIRLACDGLWLNEVLGAEVLEPSEREDVIDRLRALAVAATSSPGATDEGARGSGAPR